MTTAHETRPPASPPSPRPAVPALYRRAARESGYLLLSLPLAVAGFVLFVATISVGAPSLVAFLLGLVVLAVGLSGARALGDLERRRLAAVGHPLPPARPFVHPGGRLRWVVARLKHGQGWLDLLYQVLNFPIALVSFVLTLTWWLVGAASVLYPLWDWALPDDGTNLAELLGLAQPVEYAMYVAGGALMLLAAPWVVRALVWVHHGWARVTLGASGVTHLEEQVASLTRSRAAVVGAEAETLRRIERDLHDGPQQRLVRLSMDLEAAQRRLADGDEEATRTLLSESLEHVQGSLAELRTLSRGIAPPILVDRGLAAAVVSAAGQSPIPVETDIALTPGQRLAPARESAAYFVVTEALTNAAKHSAAARVAVRVGIDDDGVLRVVVADDGVGGAHPGKGHGLAGLRDRLAGVDGELHVESADGHGTVVSAAIP
ncbi:Signal transduction histidine kinase [Georgenia satyanarayanai]|uniref:histidine kinase n=1 Tax=Georgenia satyanarayanai TaxID=860221 RepID=A0A2Y9AAY5_9MICO|nr:sensor histidine kinase [Georgenia satyanarayanai]PYF99784.1 signal transduction histidine kinase [Georgenia satyanarayanai]SSA41764.1 Signal transduction histidine kinase [Georgenia satyanarayanai]